MSVSRELLLQLPVLLPIDVHPSACSVGKALPSLFLEQAKGVCAALKSHMAASIRATNRLSLLDWTNALVMVRSSTGVIDEGGRRRCCRCR